MGEQRAKRGLIGNVEECLSILEYSVAMGKDDAAKSAQMYDAVFSNLGQRCVNLREALTSQWDYRGG